MSVLRSDMHSSVVTVPTIPQWLHLTHFTHLHSMFGQTPAVDSSQTDSCSWLLVFPPSVVTTVWSICHHPDLTSSLTWHGAYVLLILDEMLETGLLNECVKHWYTLIRQVMLLYILGILNKNSKCTTFNKHMSTKQNIIFRHKEWITCSYKEKYLCKICLIKRMKSMY